MASSSRVRLHPSLSDGSYYIGHTVDLAARERTHNEGHGARFTAARRPVEIVYAEEWPNAIAAIRRERQLKRWSTAKKKALVALETRTLKDLARRRA